MLGQSQLNFNGISISFWGKYFEPGDTAMNVLNMGLDRIF